MYCVFGFFNNDRVGSIKEEKEKKEEKESSWVVELSMISLVSGK